MHALHGKNDHLCPFQFKVMTDHKEVFIMNHKKIPNWKIIK